MSEAERCVTCHQKIRLAHKETLNKKLLSGLQRAARKVIATSINDIDINDLIDDYSVYNNFQKLRYFGLVHHFVDAKGVRVRGHWLITRNGWAFLRGDLEVHQWVSVLDNHIADRSIETIDVKSVYRGSDIVVTTFEYFDENGRPVGYRPTLRPERQLRLV